MLLTNVASFNIGSLTLEAQHRTANNNRATPAFTKNPRTVKSNEACTNKKQSPAITKIPP